VASDLRRSGLKARKVTVKLRDSDFRTRTATRTIRGGIESDRAIAEVARTLLDELRRDRRTAARLIGIALGGFEEGEREDQLHLFAAPAAGPESEKDRNLSKAVDAVRDNFGGGAIHLGSTRPRPNPASDF
jgi:DNA polymerase-4